MEQDNIKDWIAMRKKPCIEHSTTWELLDEFEDKLKASKEELKKILFLDPEPCCHGVRQKEAFQKIDYVLGEIEDD